MRLAWLTDIHLNFLDNDRWRRFLYSIGGQAEVVAISGDIGESHDVAHYLRKMDEIVQKPIYFVLGNHDFYKGSIAKTRKEIGELAGGTKCLHYLTAMGVAELTPTTAIVGHDGWPDGRFGDFQGTKVVLSDHVVIEEIARWYNGVSVLRHGLGQTMAALADEAAQHFELILGEAAAKYRQVIAVTHVPPFKEAAWYQGKMSGKDYLPYFACRAVGEVFEKVMQANPQCKLLVLCGHTHSGGEVRVGDNIQVLTGEASYGKPTVQRVLQVE